MVDQNWKNAERVRIDSRKPGQYFRDISGNLCRYVRRDGVLSGVVWAARLDGTEECYCESAEVQPLTPEECGDAVCAIVHTDEGVHETTAGISPIDENTETQQARRQ